MANEPAASASGLVKIFSGRRVVDGVDLVVPRGTIYGVLGPNGAGKTTTLRMLLGIIEPDDGERMLLGHERPRDASDRVGYLPEERGLYPAMKAKDAIAFMGALRGLDLKTGRARAVALLEEVGLGHAADEKIRKRTEFDLYYNGSRLQMVVLRANGATYWVVNTLSDTLSNETMLAIAKGLKPLTAAK